MDFLQELNNDNTTTTILMVLALLLLDEENQTIVDAIDTRTFQPLLYRRALAGTIRRRSLQDPTQSIFWEVYKAGQDKVLSSSVASTKLDLTSS